MIQDIAPSKLDNQYKNVAPNDNDIIFLFEGSTLLGCQKDDVISYPNYKEFKESEKLSDKKFEFIYLLSVELENSDSIKFFLAKPVLQIEKGKFLGEMADSSIHDNEESLIEGYSFIGVNSFRNAKPKEVAFAAITAFHLYGWYRDNTYCGRCGGIMKHSDKERMVYCPDCKNTVYPKICPAVIVAVTDNDKILLTKYAGRAYRNYALIAGFTEIGETIDETVEREVFEEVGVRVKNLKYYKSQPWALSGSILYGFYCELDGSSKITLQEEELSVGEWVSANDLDLEDDGVSLTREMICKFVREHKTN